MIEGIFVIFLAGNWYQSRERCKKIHGAAELLIPYNDTLMDHAVSLSSGKMFWLGLINFDGKKWRLIDDTALDFSKWSTGHPKNSQNCTLAAKNGQWNSTNCDAAIVSVSVCELDLRDVSNKNCSIQRPSINVIYEENGRVSFCDFRSCSMCPHQYSSCHNISYKLGKACQYHGSCVFSATKKKPICNCDVHFQGDDCENQVVYRCNGKFSNQKGACTSHGICKSQDHCVCDVGYFDHDCSSWFCGSTQMNDSEVCSGRGDCDSPEKCDCPWTHSGTTCNSMSLEVKIVIATSIFVPICFCICMMILFLLLCVIYTKLFGRPTMKFCDRHATTCVKAMEGVFRSFVRVVLRRKESKENEKRDHHHDHHHHIETGDETTETEMETETDQEPHWKENGETTEDDMHAGHGLPFSSEGSTTEDEKLLEKPRLEKAPPKKSKKSEKTAEETNESEDDDEEKHEVGESGGEGENDETSEDSEPSNQE